MNQLNNIVIRPALYEDIKFIKSTWLPGLRHGNNWYGLIEESVYYSFYPQRIDLILAEANIQIACLKDEPEVIIGYCVSRSQTLDWIYVKRAWRRLGVANLLLPQVITIYSHITEIGKQLKPNNWIFDPFH